MSKNEMGLLISIVLAAFAANAGASPGSVRLEPFRNLEETKTYCQDRDNFGYGWLKNFLIPKAAIEQLPNPMGEACLYGAELAFSRLTEDWQAQDFVDQCHSEFEVAQIAEACLLPIVLSRLSNDLSYTTN